LLYCWYLHGLHHHLPLVVHRVVFQMIIVGFLDTLIFPPTKRGPRCPEEWADTYAMTPGQLGR